MPPLLSSDSQFSCEDVLQTGYCKVANTYGGSNWMNQRILCLQGGSPEVAVMVG